MIAHPLLEEQEARRLDAMHALQLLDGAPDPELDRITSLVADALGVKMCAVTLMDADQLWFKSGHGLNITQCPRDASFCDHVVRSNAPMVCSDLRLDARFSEHELVTPNENALRFYAGAPVHVDGAPVGTLCVLDHAPQPDFEALHLPRLLRYAEVVEAAFLARQQRLAIQRERTLFAEGPVAALVWAVHDRAPLLTYTSGNLTRLIGPERAGRLARGAQFEQLLWRQDLRTFRDALKAHALGRLTGLETTYRLDNGQTWIQQISYGDHDEEGRLVGVRAYLSDVTRQKQLESSIESTKERLYLAMESASIGTWDMNLRTRERVVNARTAAMLGYRPDEIDLSQGRWLDMIHPFDRASVAQTLETHVQACRQSPLSDVVFSSEYRVRHKGGHYIWVQSHGKVVAAPDDLEPVRIVGTLIDITASKQAEIERQRTQMLLDLLRTTQSNFLLDKSLTAACEALFEPLLRLTESQFGFIGIVDYAEDGSMLLRVPSISNISWDAPTQAWYAEQRSRQEGLVFQNLDNLFGRTVTHNEMVCTNDPTSHPASRGVPKGHPVLESFLGLPLAFNERVVGMIGLGNRDAGFDDDLVRLLTPLVTTLGTLIHARAAEDQRVQAEAQLFTQATQDGLTGLANRRRFFEVAEQAVNQSMRYGTALSLAILDLDHFKRINDTHGHSAGDAVIRQLADTLRASLRATDVGARIGGEEFAILMPSTDTSGALIPLERIRHMTATTPVDGPSEPIRVTCSIGVATWRPGLTSLDQLMALADERLYEAKGAGRNRIVCQADDPSP